MTPGDLNQPNPTLHKENSTKEISIFVGGVVIGLGMLVALYFLVYHQKPKTTTTQSTATTLQPATQQAVTVPTSAPAQKAAIVLQPTQKKVELQTCELTKEQSSLVDQLTKFSNGMTGTLRGIATKVQYADHHQLAVLELESRDKTQTTSFDVQESNARLLRLTNTPIEVSKDLHAGSPVIIGFKCSPKYENKFIITLIQTAAD